MAVLATSSEDRLADATEAAAGTRATVSLAVVTNSFKVQQEFLNASARFTFDAAVYLAGDYEETKVLVAENKAWKTVKVSLR